MTCEPKVKALDIQKLAPICSSLYLSPSLHLPELLGPILCHGCSLRLTAAADYADHETGVQYAKSKVVACLGPRVLQQAWGVNLQVMREASVLAVLVHEDDPRMRVLLDDHLMELSMVDAPRARYVCDAPLVSFPSNHHLPTLVGPFQRNEPGPVLVHDPFLAFEMAVEAERLSIALLVTKVVRTRLAEAASHGHSQILPRCSHPWKMASDDIYWSPAVRRKG
jgi:hypothetical protein